MAWDLLEENFNDLTDWTDNDAGDAVSEISPAGYLHQIATGGWVPSITQDIGTIGTGDYTVEMRVKLLNITASQNRLDVNAGTSWLAVDIEHDGIRIYDGAAMHHTDYTWDTDIYNTIRYIVHNSQTDVDVYINGVLEITDADCSATAGTDGVVALSERDANNEWSIDYLYIGAGQIEPSTTSIKKVSGVAYASIKKIGGVAIGSVKKIAGVE